MIDREGAIALLKEAERDEELAGSALVERLALLGAFDPQPLTGPDERDAVALLCERLPTGEAMLRERERIDALARMLERGGYAELARVRRSAAQVSNTPLQRMLDAVVLGGGPTLDDRTEDELLASLAVWRWITEALARAGRTLESPVEPGKDAIEGRLALLDVTRSVRRLARGGCIGREAELARLHEYRRSTPRSSDLEVEPAMVIYGIGGVGKSTLVARFAMDLYEERDDPESGVWAYLDLDRPTLASCDPSVILSDIVRQVVAQRPDEGRGLVRGEEVNRRRIKGAGLEAFDTAWSYRDNASDFIMAMHGIAGGALVVVLDTYEQLERNHPHRARELWDLFALFTSELPRFRLIVSGRTPAAAFVEQSRPDRQLHVSGLKDNAALELLRHFVRHESSQEAGRPMMKIDDGVGRDVIGLVGGIPLTVRLAARVLVEEGPAAIADAATHARTLDRVRSEFVRGFLYQRILDHMTARPPVTPDDLRQLARASIALRHITVDLVERVLVPSLTTTPEATPGHLFDELASEVAFIDSEGGTLRLREELRVPALTALRIDDEALVTRVHEHAARYYAATRNDAAAELELAYHRLALGASPSEFDAAILRQLEPATDDLPPSSAERVRDAVNDDRDALRVATNLEGSERQLVPAVDAALRAGRLDEAREMLTTHPERNPDTELYRLESRLAQAECDVKTATAAAGSDLDAASFAGDPTRFAAAAVRLAGLQELENTPGDADQTLRHAIEASLLVGNPELRLELLLNRINTRERTGADDEQSRWFHTLEARALMQRIGQVSLENNTALVRLLAAALGREEPGWIRAAVQRVGLGHLEDPVRVRRLIAALADWDMSLPEPGSLGKMFLRVEGDSPEAIHRAWTALSGLGTDAGKLLDKLWHYKTPPENVRERLREIYLYWAVEKSPDTEAHGDEPNLTFLTEVPIDWTRPEILTLEELMTTAYPTATELMTAASKAGVDPKTVSWSATQRRIVREILASASLSGHLPDLITSILADPAAVSVHEPLRALVGDTWLSTHNP